MTRRLLVVSALLFAAGSMFLCGGTVRAQEAKKAAPSSSGDVSVSSTARSAANDEAMRAEGEKRFSANCGRCHQAPHKFPPRMMATIVRHMRVRALITDEDMRLILIYMTQ